MLSFTLILLCQVKPICLQDIEVFLGKAKFGESIKDGLPVRSQLQISFGLDFSQAICFGLFVG